MFACDALRGEGVEEARLSYTFNVQLRALLEAIKWLADNMNK